MQVTYLCAVYSVFKFREGEVLYPHLVGNENEQKLTPFRKILQKKLRSQICKSTRWSELIKKAPLTGANMQKVTSDLESCESV